MADAIDFDQLEKLAQFVERHKILRFAGYGIQIDRLPETEETTVETVADEPEHAEGCRVCGSTELSRLPVGRLCHTHAAQHVAGDSIGN